MKCTLVRRFTADDVYDGRSNKASITATLVDQSERNVTTNEFIDMIDKVEAVDESADINVIPMSQSGMTSEPNTLVFQVSDDDPERLKESEDVIIDKLESDDKIDSVISSRENLVKEMQIQVDRDKARENGLQPGQIGQALYEASNGVESTTIEGEDDFLAINVKYPDSYLNSLDNFRNLKIPNARR